jgi:hypothetical protein
MQGTSLAHPLAQAGRLAPDIGAKTKLKDADLIQQFQAIEAMDEEDKNVVKKLIDAFITKKQLQKLVQ